MRNPILLGNSMRDFSYKAAARREWVGVPVADSGDLSEGMWPPDRTVVFPGWTKNSMSDAYGGPGGDTDIDKFLNALYLVRSIPADVVNLLLWRVSKWRLTVDMSWSVPSGIDASGSHRNAGSYAEKVTSQAVLIRWLPPFTIYGDGAPTRHHFRRSQFTVGRMIHNTSLGSGFVIEDDYAFGGWYLDNASGDLWRKLPGATSFAFQVNIGSADFFDPVYREWQDVVAMENGTNHFNMANVPVLRDSEILGPSQTRARHPAFFQRELGTKGLRMRGKFDWMVDRPEETKPYYTFGQTSGSGLQNLWFEGDTGVGHDFADISMAMFYLLERGDEYLGARAPSMLWNGAEEAMEVLGDVRLQSSRRVTEPPATSLTDFEYSVEFSIKRPATPVGGPDYPAGGSFVIAVEEATGLPDVSIPLYVSGGWPRSYGHGPVFNTATGDTTITLEPIEWFEFSRTRLDGTTGPRYHKATGLPVGDNVEGDDGTPTLGDDNDPIIPE